MNIRLILVFAFSIYSINVVAQEIEYTQYYLNLAGQNAGFTGIEDYLDVKLGVRQGWNNFGTKSSNVYLGMYGTMKNANLAPIKNSAPRISNPDYFNKLISNKNLRRKMGVGGMISSQDMGLYKATTILGNYAYHLPISKKMNWSFGTSVGYLSQQVNFAGYSVRDDVNDKFYQQLIQAQQGRESIVLADFGSVLYSNNFYIGVSSKNLLKKQVGGFSLLNGSQPIQYSIQSAGNLRVGENLVFSPGVKITTKDGYDLGWTINSRLRYKDLLYLGGAYENEVKTSLLLGLSINGLYSVNYSYDQYLSSLKSFNVSVHELILNISLANRYSLKPKFW